MSNKKNHFVIYLLSAMMFFSSSFYAVHGEEAVSETDEEAQEIILEETPEEDPGILEASEDDEGSISLLPEENEVPEEDQPSEGHDENDPDDLLPEGSGETGSDHTDDINEEELLSQMMIDGVSVLELCEDFEPVIEYAAGGFYVTIGSGFCGSNVKYEIRTYSGSNGEDVRLIISGSGAMTSHPWNKTIIRKIIIESGVTSICEEAFSNASNINSAELSDTVTDIGKKAFYNSNLQSVNIPNYAKLGDEAFANCSKLESVSFSSDVQGIPYRCFRNDTALKSITFPRSAHSIGQEAFSGCTSLKTIQFGISNDITQIGSNAFAHCSSLSSADLYNLSSLSKIDDYAFFSCSSLTELILPYSLDTIGAFAFSYCTRITSVAIPVYVTSIGIEAFSNCSSLKTVSINGKIKSIPNRAFIGCGSLTEINIPDSVTSIGTQAFSYCPQLHMIMIPGSVTYMGGSVFSYGSSDPIKVLFLGKAPSTWERYSNRIAAFDGVKAIIYYPNLSSSWNQYANSTEFMGDLTWVEAETAPSVSSVTAPTGTRQQGKALTLKGIIDAGSGTLQKVGTGIYRSSDTSFSNRLTGTEVSASGQTYSIQGSALDNNCKLGSLSAGSYIYIITATVSGQKYELYRSSFQVEASTYTVSYNANGGQGAPGNQTKVYGKTLYLSSSEPTRSGYRFMGWATSSGSTSVAYMPGNSYTGNSNLTLYAVWRYSIISVTFDPDGGEGMIYQGDTSTSFTSPYHVEKEVDNYYIVECYANKDHYTFLGWSENRNASAAEIKTGDILYPDKPVTLYAVYDPDEYHVYYDGQGGTNTPETMTAKFGRSVRLSTTVPEKEGYRFLGWRKTYNGVLYQPGDTIVITAATYLTAVWGRNGTASVIFHYMHGILQETVDGETTETDCYGFYSDDTNVLDRFASYEEMSVVRETSDIESTIEDLGWDVSLFNGNYYDIHKKPVRISGWSTQEHGQGVFLTKDTVVDHDMDFYPVYQYDAYKITYAANDGKLAPAADIKTAGVPLTLSSQTPVLDGFEFMGWSKDANADEPEYAAGSVFDEELNSDLVLYAVWSGYYVRYLGYGTKIRIPTGIFTVDETIPKFSASREKYLWNGTQDYAQYVFICWKDASGNLYYPNTTYSIDSSLELQAVWEPRYGIYFDLHLMVQQGNTVYAHVENPSWCIKNRGCIYGIEKYETTRNDLTLQEYGWDQYYPQYDVTGTRRIIGFEYDPDNSGEYILMSKNTLIDREFTNVRYLTIPSDHVLVTYNDNGGKGGPDSQSGPVNTDITVPAGTPVKIDYDFCGWSYSPDSAEADVYPGQTITLSADGDIVLYAVWQKSNSSLSFGGTVTIPEISASQGSEYTITENELTREGYTFIGWSLSQNSNTPDYLVGDTIQMYDNITLYPCWRMNAPVLSVSDDGNGNARLSWTEISAAVRYSVYRSETEGSDGELIAVVSENDFTDWKRPVNNSYFYTVTAEDETGNVSLSSNAVCFGNDTGLDIRDEDSAVYQTLEVPDAIWTSSLPSLTYDPSVKTYKYTDDELRVYYGKTLLTPNKDYTVKYVNNAKAALDTAAKAPKVTITGKGNYSGTITKAFSIYPRELSDEDAVIILKKDCFAYNGKTQKPAVSSVNYNGIKLKKGTDYSIEYNNTSSDIGTYEITVVLKGNYKGELHAQYHIVDGQEKRSISSVSVSGVKSFAFTGSEITQNEPEITLKDGKNILIQGTDYVISYRNNADVGKAYIVFEGIGKYSGTLLKEFRIDPLAFNTAAVTMSGFVNDFDYSSGPVYQDELILYYEGQMLTEGTDYTLTYKNNTNAGTAKLTIKGIGKYSGTLSRNFIINKLTIKDTDVSLNDSYGYSKTATRPLPVVSVNGKVLVSNADYTVSYKNNSKPGKAVITVAGKGSYDGVVTKEFTITSRDIGEVLIGVTDKAYSTKGNGWKAVPALTDTNGKKLKAGTDYEKSVRYTYKHDTAVLDGSSAGKPQVMRYAGEEVRSADIPPADTEIEVTVTGKNYYTGTIRSVYRIVTASISKAAVNVSAKYYTGNPIYLNKSDIVVKVGKNVLSSDDYEILTDTYVKNTAKGTASVKIKGTGNYGGIKTISFKIKSKSFGITVQFDGNGATSGNMSDQWICKNTALTKNRYKKTVNGKVYTFLGWSLTPEGPISFRNGDIYPYSILKTGRTIILYAVWE